MAEYIKRIDVLKAMREVWQFKDGEDAIKEVVSRIKNLPSSDVQPVKHGRWETEICDDGYGAYNLFVCSLCGSESAKRFNYCRECGAIMDGET